MATSNNRIRNINIDLIKVVAVFSVIWVHFFLNTNFYEASLHGWSGYFAVALRTAFMVCVPLFLMATGYLMKNKTLSKKYYVGITRTISIYIVISIVCILFRILYLNQDVTVMGAILRILNYSGCGYAWYIEMYVVLFLVIPFLNLVYQGLDTQTNRKILLGTLMFVVALPPVANLKWQILPAWWSSDVLFPIMFYYIGAYLRDYPIKIKRTAVWFCCFIAWIGCCAAMNYYLCISTDNNMFGWPAYVGWGSLQNMVSAGILFALIQSLRLPSAQSIAGKVIIRISRYSLGMYLTSWMIDQTIYPLLVGDGKSFNTLFPEMFWITFVIIILAFIASWVCTELAERLANPIEKRLKERLV